jgi:hypothetical protein
MGDTYIQNSVLREKASPSETKKLQKLRLLSKRNSYNTIRRKLVLTELERPQSVFCYAMMVDEILKTANLPNILKTNQTAL